MSLNSLFFVFLFLPVGWLLQRFVPEKGKNAVLLLLSVAFIAWGSPRDMLRTSHKITFYYGDNLQRLESATEDGECVINFNNKWYHTREDFFEKAEVDGVRLTSVYDELYGFKVD